MFRIVWRVGCIPVGGTLWINVIGLEESELFGIYIKGG